MSKFLKIIILISMSISLSCSCVHGQGAIDEIDNDIDSLMSLLKSTSNDSRKIKLLDQICLIHYNVDSTLKYANMELQIAEKLHDNSYMVSAYNYLGWGYLQIVDLERSRNFYLKALGICDSLSHERGMAASCYGLGNVYSALGDDATADDYYLKAVEYYKMLGMNDLVTDIYRNLVLVRIEYHLYETISNIIDEAFELDTQAGDSSALGADYFMLGWSLYEQYRDFGDPELLLKAKDEMSKGYKMASKYEYVYINYSMCNKLMFVYHDIAKIKSRSDKQIAMDSARYFYNLTEDYMEQCSMGSQKIYLDLWNAEDFALQGNPNMSLPILNEIESQPGLTWEMQSYLYKIMAFTYESLSDYANAFKYTDMLNHIDKERHNREFGVKVTSVQYERELSQQKLLQQRRKFTIYIIVLCIGMVALIAVASLHGYSRNRKLNKRLASRNNDIRNVNNELSARNAEIQAQRDEIELQRNNISATTKMLLDSINYAKHIQDAVVTSRETMHKMFGDTLIFWKPMNVVSGDFYWAMQRDNLKLLVLADCTGHGVPGGFMSMFAILSLNSIVSPLSFANIKASDVLDMLRAKVIGELHQMAGNGDSIESVDMAFCIIDTVKMQVQYAGANRPLLIVRDGEVNVYKPDKMSVGLNMLRKGPFANNVIDLKKNDVLYMYTDGITDQFGYEDGSAECIKFTSKRLDSLLKRVSGKSFDAQYEIVGKALDDWRTSPENTLIDQFDDQLLLGIRIS